MPVPSNGILRKSRQTSSGPHPARQGRQKKKRQGLRSKPLSCHSGSATASRLVRNSWLRPASAQAAKRSRSCARSSGFRQRPISKRGRPAVRKARSGQKRQNSPRSTLQFPFTGQCASTVPMKFARSLLARSLAFAATLCIATQPLAAQSSPTNLRHAETEALLRDMVDPLAEAAGLQRGAVEVVLVSDPSINAFVAGGQRIYVHSGLINAADTANEVQGVLAHELGHITGG